MQAMLGGTVCLKIYVYSMCYCVLRSARKIRDLLSVFLTFCSCHFGLRSCESVVVFELCFLDWQYNICTQEILQF